MICASENFCSIREHPRVLNIAFLGRLCNISAALARVDIVLDAPPDYAYV
jgi:hypothetical protein